MRQAVCEPSVPSDISSRSSLIRPLSVVVSGRLARRSFNAVAAMSQYQWVSLFEELPYAAAINDEYLTTRCSNCVKEASTPCPKCTKVVYCDDQCSKADRLWHSMECAAGPHEMGSDIRLMARFGYRQQVDGGVTSLSTNFPPGYKVS